jgi:mannose-6-phosphate isomerase-like protein (cupin superfamily)
VKRAIVDPGVAVSLQSHHHWSEHRIVGEDEARVTIDDNERLVAESIRSMLPGAAYRIEYRRKVPTVLMEVQTGSHLGVDDTSSREDADVGN